MVRKYIQNIGIELIIEKCAMLIMKSGKQQMTEEREREKCLNQNDWRNGSLKYIGIFDSDNIEQVEVKKKKIKKGIP